MKEEQTTLGRVHSAITMAKLFTIRTATRLLQIVIAGRWHGSRDEEARRILIIWLVMTIKDEAGRIHGNR